MPSMVADGWLVAIIIALIPVSGWIAKGVANKWRLPLEIEQKLRAKAEASLVERTEDLTEAKIRIMFLESKLEYCEGEIDNWRSGKWTSP